MKPNYAWIGWHNEQGHDKVWGIIKLSSDEFDHWEQGHFVSFWGRRGKKLQTKLYHDYGWEMEKLWEKKEDKGYQEIDMTKLNEVYPDFEKDLEKMAFWAQFKV